MSLATDFFEMFLENILKERLGSDDFGIIRDTSKFIVVDGEEGDYGKIKYKDSGGYLIAIKTVYGGDNEDIEFTKYGIEFMAKNLNRIMEDLCRRIYVVD